MDDDEWWMPHVERLADLRITFGCQANPLSFCPDETVTRARMASFLVRALDLAEAPSAGFADTGGSTHEASIDALFGAGVTVGCKQDPLRYCPNDPVSRAQMATLLRRVLDSRPTPAPFTIGAGPRSGDTLLAAGRGRTCAARHDATVACRRPAGGEPAPPASTPRWPAGARPGANLHRPPRRHGGLLAAGRGRTCAARHDATVACRRPAGGEPAPSASTPRWPAGGRPGANLHRPPRRHGGLLGRRRGTPGTYECLGAGRRRRAEHRRGPRRWAAHLCGAHRWDRLLLGAGERGPARAGQHRDPPSAGGGSRHRRHGGCGREAMEAVTLSDLGPIIAAMLGPMLLFAAASMRYQRERLARMESDLRIS